MNSPGKAEAGTGRILLGAYLTLPSWRGEGGVARCEADQGFDLLGYRLSEARVTVARTAEAASASNTSLSKELSENLREHLP